MAKDFSKSLPAFFISFFESCQFSCRFSDHILWGLGCLIFAGCTAHYFYCYDQVPGKVRSGRNCLTHDLRGRRPSWWRRRGGRNAKQVGFAVRKQGTGNVSGL